MDPNQGLRIIKVPLWLSEEWLKAEAGAEVAEIDLNKNELKLLQVSQDPGKPRPTNFVLERRPSPELFAFPVLEENAEDRVQGGIVEHLTLAPNLKDPGYDKMIKERNETAERERPQTKLTDDISDNRQQRLAAQSIKAPRKDEPMPEGPNKTGGAIWLGVKKALLENEGGVTTEELLEYLPRMPAFLDVRNALSSLAEATEADDGRRIFIQRRRTAAEVKVELKMEQEAGRNFKREQQAKREQREQSAKAEQAKAEHARSKKEEPTGGPNVKKEQEAEPGTSASSSANAAAGGPRAGSAGAASSSTSAPPSSAAPPQKRGRTTQS